MKLLMYDQNLQVMKKSGIYRAFQNQTAVLEQLGIPYTTNPAEDWDIVQLNTFLPNFYFMAKRARRMGKKVVYYAHSTREDFENSFVGSNLLAPVFQWWITQCYSTGDVVITPTDYSADLLSVYGIKAPIVPISNGIDLAQYHRDPAAAAKFRERFGYGPQDKVILGIGHYIERKGIQDFIELARLRPDFQFIWLGHTDPSLLTPAMRSLLKKIPSNMKLPGYIDHEDLKGAYLGSDVFFMPTYEETEGLTLLEALALNVPVLVRDIPIYSKWLRENVDVYKGRTNAEFLKTLDRMLYQTLPDLTDSGYEKVRERSLDRTAQKLKDVYESLMRKD
ncbi:glycosyltransferase family 4 protein [Clostridiaceae bacterium HFYG-1003]|nr:glycosyltransferase family 4 protein [Clostridiaceae bacterium HFYG-1003]